MIQAMFVPTVISTILATQFGLGTRDSQIDHALHARAALYMGYWQMFYAASVTLVKAGIAVALLRLTSQRRYKYPLWGLLFAAPAFTLGCVILIVTTCNPIGAQWDQAMGSCSTHNLMAELSYLFTVFTIIMDGMCAIIPYLLLKDVKMRRRVKNSLIIVLAIGGLAAAAAVVRIPFLKYYLIEEDQLCKPMISIFSFGKASPCSRSPLTFHPRQISSPLLSYSPISKTALELSPFLYRPCGSYSRHTSVARLKHRTIWNEATPRKRLVALHWLTLSFRIGQNH